MIDTSEYYGGTYPDPPQEVIDCEDEDDYDEWFADYYFEDFYYGGGINNE